MSEKRSFFNIPIAGSLLDAVFLVVAVLATAYFWYHSRGVPKIEQAAAEVVATADAVQDTISFERARINERRQDVADAEALRDSLDREIVAMKARIPVEIERIQEAQERSQQLTADFLQLRGRLGQQRDLLRDTRLEVDNLRATAEELIEQDIAFRDSAFAADQSRLALAREVEDMIAYRERDPWSMFPTSASLSAYVDLSDEANFFSLSLAKDFYRTGKMDLGLTGALGFSGEQGTSIREAGVYANFELAFRRASLDLGAGVSSVRIGTDDDSTEPYVSLMLRYAPYYRERAFLLVGTKYSHETLSLLVGVGFGRR